MKVSDLDSKKPAFPNTEGNVWTLDASILEQAKMASRAHPRKRVIIPLHRTQEAMVQRMINVLQPGTYIRPHMHPREMASESIVIASGSIQFLVFDELGRLTQSIRLEANKSNIIDIEPHVWHSFLVLTPDTVIYEFKRGPYDAEHDKTFAPWAPEEGTPEAGEYLNTLHIQEE